MTSETKDAATCVQRVVIFFLQQTQPGKSIDKEMKKIEGSEFQYEEVAWRLSQKSDFPSLIIPVKFLMQVVWHFSHLLKCLSGEAVMVTSSHAGGPWRRLKISSHQKQIVKKMFKAEAAEAKS